MTSAPAQRWICRTHLFQFNGTSLRRRATPGPGDPAGWGFSRLWTLVVAIDGSSASLSQSKDSGTRCGAPSAGALATQTPFVAGPTLRGAPTLSSGSGGRHSSVVKQPGTLTSGSVTVATRQPPPASCAGSFTVPSVHVTAAIAEGSPPSSRAR